MNIIAECFQELLPLAHLLYGKHGTVRYRWYDGTWKHISMMEGINQGCPLSCLFRALVLDRVLQPLDRMLREKRESECKEIKRRSWG